MDMFVKCHRIFLLIAYLGLQFLFFSPRYAIAETRCYDNLGCYDSGILHALPQDPAFVRTQMIGSHRGHVDDVTITAVDKETEWRKLIDASSMDTTLDTTFIIHGFTDSASAEWVGRMRDALLNKSDSNVFTVDWSHGANFPYQQAVANTFMVAKQLTNFLDYLERVHGLSPSRIHLIGHSLGAQIAGNAGSFLKTSHVARISALDPAEPFFGFFNDSMRLDASDALFVDVIHTDGEVFSGFHGYGSLRQQGHADFYPNGGMKQPGCNDPNAPFGIKVGGSIQQTISCSHTRAVHLFIASLETGDDHDCLFEAHPCKSWDDFDKGRCHACPQDGCPLMGIKAASSLNGSFYLSTSSRKPFCGMSYKVTVTTSKTPRHSYGRLLVSLHGLSAGTEQIELNRANHHYHENEAEEHVITVSSSGDIGDVTSVELEFQQGSGLSSLGTSSHLEISSVSVSNFLGNHQSWSYVSNMEDTTTTTTTTTTTPVNQSGGSNSTASPAIVVKPLVMVYDRDPVYIKLYKDAVNNASL